jgi:hypothetical protein
MDQAFNELWKILKSVRTQVKIETS